MTAKQQKIDYLEEVTGMTADFKPLPNAVKKNLAFFLRDLYELQLVTMMGHTFVLAGAKEPAAPNELLAHADVLRKTLNTDIAFEFHALPPYLRQRLVQKGIAFIVPGTHLFLPFMMMDFRTRARNAAHAAGEAEGPLSMPAQLVLLYHLEREPIGDRTLGDLSKQFGYSAMTLSRVVAELVQRGICEAEREGVRKHLRFNASGRELWEKALPHLLSPVIAAKAAKFEKHASVKQFHAGITGLADYTSLADDAVPTIALSAQDWRNALMHGNATELPYQEENGVRVEVWGYDPKPLAEPGSPAVDRLSLYLSCKDSNDERVQISLDNLMEQVQWRKDRRKGH